MFEEKKSKNRGKNWVWAGTHQHQAVEVVQYSLWVLYEIKKISDCVTSVWGLLTELLVL
jgi:hypothetical protein